jgi:hypothetical protein
LPRANIIALRRENSANLHRPWRAKDFNDLPLARRSKQKIKTLFKNDEFSGASLSGRARDDELAASPYRQDCDNLSETRRSAASVVLPQ